jgi:homoserine O-acetyltransferase
MGGMHSWLWGELHPEFMDALLPLASLPTQISGRNRVWRRMIIDAIRDDPEWRQGEYAQQPAGLHVALEVLYFMGNNAVQRYKEATTLHKADELLDAYVAQQLKTTDANDILYAVEASHDYNPGPDLEKIQAPLLAINFADDLINPPELGILEREIKRLPHGRAIVMPTSEQTRGHGTHTLAAVWQQYFGRVAGSNESGQKLKERNTGREGFSNRKKRLEARSVFKGSNGPRICSRSSTFQTRCG